MERRALLAIRHPSFVNVAEMPVKIKIKSVSARSRIRGNFGIGISVHLCQWYDMGKLNAARVKTALAGVSDWKKKGSAITRTYEFKDFPAAVRFVNAVARIAEKAWHHPDIDIRWNKVTLTLSTHDAGGLTEKDFRLAKQFDRL
jgi:4a-hydroxytetrahydrobiopterin dehydratase